MEAETIATELASFGFGEGHGGAPVTLAAMGGEEFDVVEPSEVGRAFGGTADPDPADGLPSGC